jgi:hypothetical protein
MRNEYHWAVLSDTEAVKNNAGTGRFRRVCIRAFMFHYRLSRPDDVRCVLQRVAELLHDGGKP